MHLDLKHRDGTYRFRGRMAMKTWFDLDTGRQAFAGLIESNNRNTRPNEQLPTQYDFTQALRDLAATEHAEKRSVTYEELLIKYVDECRDRTNMTTTGTSQDTAGLFTSGPKQAGYMDEDAGPHQDPWTHNSQQGLPHNLLNSASKQRDTSNIPSIRHPTINTRGPAAPNKTKYCYDGRTKSSQHMPPPPTQHQQEQRHNLASASCSYELNPIGTLPTSSCPSARLPFQQLHHQTSSRCSYELKNVADLPTGSGSYSYSAQLPFQQRQHQAHKKRRHFAPMSSDAQPQPAPSVNGPSSIHNTPTTGGRGLQANPREPWENQPVTQSSPIGQGGQPRAPGVPAAAAAAAHGGPWQPASGVTDELCCSEVLSGISKCTVSERAAAEAAPARPQQYPAPIYKDLTPWASSQHFTTASVEGRCHGDKLLGSVPQPNWAGALQEGVLPIAGGKGLLDEDDELGRIVDPMMERYVREHFNQASPPQSQQRAAFRQPDVSNMSGGQSHQQRHQRYYPQQQAESHCSS